MEQIEKLLQEYPSRTFEIVCIPFPNKFFATIQTGDGDILISGEGATMRACIRQLSDRIKGYFADQFKATRSKITAENKYA